MADRLEDLRRLIIDAMDAWDEYDGEDEERYPDNAAWIAEALAPHVVLREDLQQVGAYFVDDSLVIVYRIREAPPVAICTSCGWTRASDGPPELVRGASSPTDPCSECSSWLMNQEYGESPRIHSEGG